MANPIIESLERTGLPPWNDGRVPRCPCCGEETDTLYRNPEGDVVGCGECLTAYDAWEALGDD